jgi:hypothetical protein
VKCTLKCVRSFFITYWIYRNVYILRSFMSDTRLAVLWFCSVDWLAGSSLNLPINTGECFRLTDFGPLCRYSHTHFTVDTHTLTLQCIRYNGMNTVFNWLDCKPESVTIVSLLSVVRSSSVPTLVPPKSYLINSTCDIQTRRFLLIAFSVWRIMIVSDNLFSFN